MGALRAFDPRRDRRPGARRAASSTADRFLPLPTEVSPRSSATWLVAACLLAGRAGAEAPRYEIEDALVVRETAQGTRHSVDVRVVRYFLAHVAKHAGSYPPRFENPSQRPEVEREARGLIAIFDVLLEPQPTDPGLLLDAGFAYGGTPAARGWSMERGGRRCDPGPGAGTRAARGRSR